MPAQHPQPACMTGNAASQPEDCPQCDEWSMPTPAVSLKFRKLRRRFGITAPRVVVRTHVSWHWYAAGGALVALVVLMILGLALQRGNVGAMETELESLRLHVRSLDEELLRFRSTAGTEQNAVQMERSTQQRLLDQVRALELENSALKEDMLLFERLIPAAGEEGAIRLENFRVVSDGAQSFRYRVLMSFHSGWLAPEVRGRLEFLITFVQREKPQEMVVPSRRERAGEFQVEVRNVLRKEGSFELPAGARLKSVEARVLQGDTLKARRVAQL